MTKSKKENTTDTEKVDEKEAEVSKEEALEEIMEETPEAEVVEERELPKKAGEETTDTILIGGALYRVVVTDEGTSYVPL